MLFELKKYYPDYVLTIKDIRELLDVNSMELRRVYLKALQINDNFALETCDEKTLEQYEDLVSIYPTPGETIENRKRDVYMVLNLHLPYSLPVLRENLNTLLTKDGYELIVNYNAQTISVIVFRLLGANQKTVKIVEKLLLQMSPSHLGTSATLGNKWEGDTNEYYGCANSIATIYETHTTYTPEHPPATWEDVLNDYGTGGDVYNSEKTWKQIYYG